MIKRLKAKNFTVLRDVDVLFSPDLNVIIGENGSGKTHVIKLLYSVLSALASGENEKATLKQRLSEKLCRVFMPLRLGRLTTRAQGRVRTEVSVSFDDKAQDVQFSFATISSEVTVGKSGRGISDRPVYFQAKELLSIFPHFLSLYGDFNLPYDETYYDTMKMLGRPYPRGRHVSKFEGLISLIEDAIGGTIRLDTEGKSFHLLMRGEDERRGNMEIDLVAEGWRKLGMLTQVVLNNSLKNGGCLFWDEPEANLNPKLIKVVAKAIFNIATKSKIQVFVTTHSLFLLRELEFLSMSEAKGKSVRYIGINADNRVDQGDSSMALKVITALEAELEQSERVLSVGRG